ncbi:ribulose-phosphate 3-epimerase [Anaerosporobacter sp.]
MNKLKISASLWSGELDRLAETIKKVDLYVDSYHFDIMDNNFVQGFLFSAPIIKSLRKYTSKSFDIHLMCQNPISTIDELIDAGADTFMIHFNTCENLEDMLVTIHDKQKKSGLVLNIDESIENVIPYLQYISVIVLMGTALGIKGATFDNEVYNKIAKLKNYKCNYDFDIQIDGGIRKNTVPEMIKNGADVITAGSLLFENNYEEIRTWYDSLIRC